MRRLFGQNRARAPKQTTNLDDSPISTPIYQQHAVTSIPPSHPTRNTSREEDRRDIITPYVTTPLASPNIPSSPSPYYSSSQASLISANKHRDTPSIRRTPPTQPIVSNILRALEPPNVETIPHSNRSASEDGYSTVGVPFREPGEYGERREKKGFWAWDRNKDHDKDRGRDLQRREDEMTAELTKMIGYLTATASEDWALVLDVCHRASANENNAKEAVKALRREFKYGEPAGQLSAARLWAIMLCNCSDVFVTQSMSRKFLETIQELLMNPKTSPVVRERLLDVIAAAAYASQSKKDSKNDRDSFRALWRRVKPIDKPDEGMPFAADDVMFNPPIASRTSQQGAPVLTAEPQILANDIVPTSPPPPTRSHRKRKSPTRNRIIPHDEDVRRLLQECKIGQGNASLLSSALFHAKPETFKKDVVIREFYQKCRSSQELIFAQVPWATAEAEKSIVARDAQLKSREVNGDVRETTKEEQLLAAILAANEELLEALKQYDDMDRVALERKVEYRSAKEARMDQRELQETLEPPKRSSHHFATGPPSRSPSPSIRSASPHSIEPQRYHPDTVTSTLAPPPSAPFGPRSPGQFSVHSRTPSPNTAPVETREINGAYHAEPTSLYGRVSYETGNAEVDVSLQPQPSAKALGKQKAVDIESSDPYLHHEGDGSYYSEAVPDRRNSHTFDDSDHEDHLDPPWHRPTHYVYDAAAERTAQRLREGYEQQTLLVNGVH